MKCKPLTEALLLLPSRSWAFLARPARAWQDLGPPPAAWYIPLLCHALPLAFIPAIGWAVGKAMFPLTDPDAAKLASSIRDPSFFSGPAEAIVGTVLLCLLSVALFAIAIHWLAPFYRVRRDWTRAVEVAAYGSTPVFLAGVFMFWPLLIFISIAALFPCCRVVYLGLQSRMGCRGHDASAYVVLAMVSATTMSLLVGAAGGALGLI